MPSYHGLLEVHPKFGRKLERFRIRDRFRDWSGAISASMALNIYSRPSFNRFYREADPIAVAAYLHDIDKLFDFSIAPISIARDDFSSKRSS